MFSHGRIAWCWGTTLLAGAVGVALLAAGDLAGQPPRGARLRSGRPAGPAGASALPGGRTVHDTASVRPFLAAGRSQRASADALPAMGPRGTEQHREDSGLLGHGGQAGADRREVGRLRVHVRKAAAQAVQRVHVLPWPPVRKRARGHLRRGGQSTARCGPTASASSETMFGTVSLAPDGVVAMRGQRYPLTDMGILHLTRRLIEVAEQDSKYGECEVKYFKGAKINNRVCTLIQVIHPTPRRNFLFNLARIFVDDELNIPIRYEAYEWPRGPGGTPELIEKYTYLNLKLNNGFTDADFDTHNSHYHFR